MVVNRCVIFLLLLQTLFFLLDAILSSPAPGFSADVKDETVKKWVSKYVRK